MLELSHENNLSLFLKMGLNTVGDDVSLLKRFHGCSESVLSSGVRISKEASEDNLFE